MTRHIQLKDQAYVNDIVLHQNACADRKLQQQLNQLDKMQSTQRKRLEHAQHYFTVLHKVVPSFNTTAETERRQNPIGKSQSRPGLKKRFTEPTMSTRFAEEYNAERRQAELRAKSRQSHKVTGSEENVGSHDKICLEAFRRGSLYRDYEQQSVISNARSLRHITPSNASDIHSQQPRVTENAKITPVSRQAWGCPNESESFVVEGKHTRISERHDRKSCDRLFRNQGEATTKNSNDLKCADFVRQTRNFASHNETDSNGSQVREKRSLSDSDSASRNISPPMVKFGESAISPVSDISTGDASSDFDSKLPNINEEQNIALRVSGSNTPSRRMKMLYQIRDGHLDVRRNQTRDDFHSEFIGRGEKTTIDGLKPNLTKRLTKARSLEHKGKGIVCDRPDTPIVTGSQMTLVKFLPKSKQAFYLKYGDDVSNRFSKSWHGMPNTHF